jgi:hypothetical protein
MKTSTKTEITPGALIALGAGVAALATTSYYFFGPKGKDHREHLKGWMIKMKGEIIDKIEDAKELTEPVYRDIIDSVVATYAATAKVSKEELHAFAERLKDQWQDIVLSTAEDRKRITQRKAKTQSRGARDRRQRRRKSAS